MRIIGEIPHPTIKITIFHWNNRYLIKLEDGLLEQTFKIHEWDTAGERDVIRLVDEPFLKEAIERFEQMSQSLTQTQARNNPV
jgi:hypothetical protein